MEYKKDFQSWHIKKENINAIEKSPFFHESEVWFCHLGVNVGFEQDGKGDDFLRPVIVLRKFNKNMFWAIPLTKANKKKKNSKYFYLFSFLKDVESAAVISQIRLIDSKRLGYKVGEVSKDDFLNIKEKLKALIP